MDNESLFYRKNWALPSDCLVGRAGASGRVVVDLNAEVIGQYANVVEHLFSALQALDHMGAHATAAIVDSSIHSFRDEMQILTFNRMSEIDFSQLDSMIDKMFSQRVSEQASNIIELK